MNFPLAIRRSYRYFIPRFIFDPHRIIRDLYPSSLIFVMGISVGAEAYANRSQVDRISNFTIGAMLTLLLVNRWACRGRSKDESPEA